MPHGRNWVRGEQLAQLDNRDPFAPPVWRSPVYRTPEAVILVVQLLRLIWRVLWFALTHPLTDAAALLVFATWLGLGWPGIAGLAAAAVIGPGRAADHATGLVRPVRRGAGAGSVAVVVLPAPVEGRDDPGRARPGLPRPADAAGARQGAPGRVRRPGAGRPGHRAGTRPTSPPRPRTWRTRSAPGCAGSATSRPGTLLLELVRADTLADPIPALPITGEVDLAGLPVGRCEDGSPWRLRLLSTHVLIAGATGSGKGSVIWSLIRALLPAIAAGWVQVWALDPKRMELSFGRALFHRYACQAAAMVELLEAAVAEMHDRAGQFGGRTRTFPLSAEFPFVVVLVDELAFLTAYQPERDLRKRAEAAIATLTSQGRSVGVCVVGALQDPRKDVISLRNLFSTRIALRLDESDQVDMVLGDGARDRGALADEISPLPEIGAGVGYVRLEASPDPVRVRAAYVTDADIRAMAEAVGYLPGGGL